MGPVGHLSSSQCLFCWVVQQCVVTVVAEDVVCNTEDADIGTAAAGGGDGDRDQRDLIGSLLTGRALSSTYRKPPFSFLSLVTMTFHFFLMSL